MRALHPYLPGALPVSREKLPDAFGLSATSVPEVRLRVLHQVVEVEPDCASALFRLRHARQSLLECWRLVRERPDLPQNRHCRIEAAGTSADKE